MVGRELFKREFVLDLTMRERAQHSGIVALGFAVISLGAAALPMTGFLPENAAGGNGWLAFAIILSVTAPVSLIASVPVVYLWGRSVKHPEWRSPQTTAAAIVVAVVFVAFLVLAVMIVFA